MRSEDIFFDLRATMDEIERPWAAFIGAITLRPSPYVSDVDAVYAINPARTGFPDLGQAVVIHPDGIEVARAAARRFTGRKVTDAELAALLYWMAHQKRKRQAPQGEQP